MTCPTCDHQNPADMHLCVQCAAPLVGRCDRCGFTNPAGFQFCGRCGYRVGASQVRNKSYTDMLNQHLREMVPEAFADQIAADRGRQGSERREVTVLFLDVQGFTAFSERRDPESVWERIDRYRHALVDIVYAFEGSVDKFTGDGMMALFGVPVAHENDPERACRAALQMQRALQEINQELEQEGEVPLGIRIGINTGRAVAGSLGPNFNMEYTVLGDTVNVAQRLESAAEGGTILISETVYQRIAPLFVVEPLGGQQVKGRETTVNSYRLEGLRGGNSPAAGGPRLPFVGRSQVVATLDEVAAQTRLNDGRIVVITGEAGIGKSRLLQEWQNSLPPDQFNLYRGASLSYRQPISYWPFITILRDLFEIQEQDDVARCWAKLDQGLREAAPEIPPEEMMPFLAHLLGLPYRSPEMAQHVQRMAPPQLRQQSFIALRTLLATVAYHRPLFLVLEDLQWADSATLDLLLFLMSKSKRLPLSFVLVSRPGEGPLDERLKDLRTHFDERLVEVEMDPLSDDAMTRLASAWVASADGVSSLPARLLAPLLAWAGGNPLFLEELLQNWATDSDLLAQVTRRQTGGIGSAELVPPSLAALITARLDGLPVAARRTLQLGAVIGGTFPRDLLVHIAAEQSIQLDLDASMPLLKSTGLIRRTAEGDNWIEWSFRHPLVRETIYHELLHSRRRMLHRVVGRSLEALVRAGSAPRPLGHEGQQAELLVYHFEQAEAWEEALPYLLEAAKQAADRFDNGPALTYALRALRLTEFGYVTIGQQMSLHEMVADLHATAGQFEAAEWHYRGALALVEAPSLWSAPASAELHRKLARLNERRGEFDAAIEWLTAALSQLADHEDEESFRGEQARILNDMGWVLHRRGNPDDLPEAQRLAFQSLELLEGLDRPHDVASAYNRLVETYSLQGEWEQALDFALRSLALRDGMGYQPGVISSCLGLATLLGRLGRWNDALTYARRAVDTSRAASSPESECEGELLQAHLELQRGDIEEAAAAVDRGYALAKSLRDVGLKLRAGILLAEVTMERDQISRAHLLTLKALELAKQAGSTQGEIAVYLLHARVLLRRDRLKQAMSEALQALDRAEEAKEPTLEADALRLVAQCYLRLNRPDKAWPLLRRAGQLYSRMNLQYDLAQTELFVAEFYWRLNQRERARTTVRRAREVFEALGATGALARTVKAAAGSVAPPPTPNFMMHEG